MHMEGREIKKKNIVYNNIYWERMLSDGYIVGVSKVGFPQLYDYGEIFSHLCLPSIVCLIILEAKLFRVVCYGFVSVL